MYLHPATPLQMNMIPLLDDEFDKAEDEQDSSEPGLFKHLVLCHDRAWEDQIDEGKEVSL